MMEQAFSNLSAKWKISLTKSLETLSMPKGIIEEKLKTLHKFRRTIDVLEVINNEKQKNN